MGQQFFSFGKEKIFSTIIIVSFLFVGAFVADFINRQLLPQELLSDFETKLITQIISENPSEIVSLGIKIMLVNLTVTLLSIYIAVSIIFKLYFNRKKSR